VQTFHQLIAGACFAFIILFASVGARAEGFLDIYAGTAKTDTGKSELTTNMGSVSGDVDYKSSFTGGVRGGAWVSKYFGLGVDVFHLNSDVANGSAEQSNWAFAADLMARLPLLADENVPNGRLQPYLTAGPAIFVSTLQVPGFSDARSTALGFKGGAGIKFLFTKNIGLFGEYRYTYFESKHDFQAGFTTGELTQQIGTHHLVGGLAFHF
jgi:opacity protein-like surface antigen